MIKLLQGKGDLIVDLPPQWEPKQTIFKEASSVDTSAPELMMRALAKPIKSPRLEELLNSESRVAIVVDDITRPTPIRDLLPRVLELIGERGVSRANVDIVIGTGTHRPLTDKELEERVGSAVAKTYRVKNHDAHSPELVVMGKIPGYGPVSFNGTVARADVKIIVGSTLPHVHSGFGGGPKNIMPGICNFETIRKHHLKNVLHHHSRVGITRGNPFLQDAIQIAKLARIDFAIQCLSDTFGQIYEVLAGDVLAVHRAAIKKQTERLGVPVTGKTDVTIVSSFPYNEGIQCMKAFMPSAMVTKLGGTIFVVTEVSEPFPDFFLESVRTVRKDGGDEAEANVLEKLNRNEPLIDAAMDFNMALILIFSVSRRFKLTMIGHEVLRNAAEAMGYNYSPDLAMALREEQARHDKATVSIIPAGGYIFPIISDPFYLFGGG